MRFRVQPWVTLTLSCERSAGDAVRDVTQARILAQYLPRYGLEGQPTLVLKRDMIQSGTLPWGGSCI